MYSWAAITGIAKEVDESRPSSGMRLEYHDFQVALSMHILVPYETEYLRRGQWLLDHERVGIP